MAIPKTEAVILDRMDYSNTSLIVTCYTQHFGRLSILAKGARRPRSPFQGTLDLLNHNELVFYRHTRSSLHTLSESTVLEGFPGIRGDLPRTYAATYLAELVREMTRDEEAQPEIFDLLVVALRELSAGLSVHRVLFQFEIQLLNLTGYLPELARCVSCSAPPPRKGRLFFSNQAGGILCPSCAGKATADTRPASPGAAATLRILLRKNLIDGRTVAIAPDIAEAIQRILRPYLIYRLEKEPRSLRFLS
ncbi:MAG: DNA repair protein RecO [Planctomycetes bacterium]|nr:DNA repair protein RecO [Planctomycetota bacterium]